MEIRLQSIHTDGPSLEARLGYEGNEDKNAATTMTGRQMTETKGYNLPRYGIYRLPNGNFVKLESQPECDYMVNPQWHHVGAP
ncbi:hypothetical protein PM082_019993 [Marasmius tenuissimus]|nr:hypothetical protein PM082_019993 [Marasmius tenuissimus]